MRITRVRTDRPRYGLLIDDNNLVVLDGDPSDLPEGLPDGPTVRVSDCRILAPVVPEKIIGIVRNYRAHAEEMALTLGSTPSVFLKPLETVIPHRGTVVFPSHYVSSHVEHEAEVAVVIGRQARNVRSADWADYVLGFTCANEVSARDLQKSAPQITRGKGFDTFCPLGPWVNTDFARDEPTEVVCTVNGVEKQRATTGSLIFSHSGTCRVAVVVDDVESRRCYSHRLTRGRKQARVGRLRGDRGGRCRYPEAFRRCVRIQCRTVIAHPATSRLSFE